MNTVVLLILLLETSAQEQTIDEIVRSLEESVEAPEEATVLREYEDSLLIQAKPRFHYKDFPGSVEAGPAPPIVYLRLKIRGRECRAYWSWNHERPTLDHTKQHQFRVSGPVDGLNECFIRKVWLGDEVIFERRTKANKRK